MTFSFVASHINFSLLALSEHVELCAPICQAEIGYMDVQKQVYLELVVARFVSCYLPICILIDDPRER